MILSFTPPFLEDGLPTYVWTMLKMQVSAIVQAEMVDGASRKESA